MESLNTIKKKQYIILVGLFGGLILIIAFGLWITDPNRNKTEKIKTSNKEELKKFDLDSKDIIDPKDAWIALSEKEINTVKDENKELREKLDNMVDKISKIENKEKASIDPDFNLNKQVPNYEDINLPNFNNIKNNSNEKSSETEIKEPKKDYGIESIDLFEIKEKNEVKDLSKNISHYIPAGSFSKVVLLSGVDAPTGGLAQQNPMPILLKVVDNGQLPNFSKSKIKDCHAIGAAYGDISSERAMIRLEVLSCVLENGKVIESKIRGFIAGEDGKSGFRGKLISKQGSLIAKSALAGAFSGIGNAISQQYKQISTNALGSVQSYDPNKIVESGLANGASTALEKIADFYIARANETYPIIEVDSNRVGEIILTSGAELNEEFMSDKSETENEVKNE